MSLKALIFVLAAVAIAVGATTPPLPRNGGNFFYVDVDKGGPNLKYADSTS